MLLEDLMVRARSENLSVLDKHVILDQLKKQRVLLPHTVSHTSVVPSPHIGMEACVVG